MIMKRKLSIMVMTNNTSVIMARRKRHREKKTGKKSEKYLNSTMEITKMVAKNELGSIQRII